MISDAKMQNEVMEELARGTATKTKDRTVRALNEVVTLSGTTANYAEKTAAEFAGQCVPDAKGALNKIDVKPELLPSEIKEVIKVALRRNTQLDAQSVKVTTDEGRVTLSGNVRTWDNRREIATAAWHAPGVTHVENLLEVS